MAAMAKERKDADDAGLWEAYRANPTDGTRNAILEHHWDWVCRKVEVLLAKKRCGALCGSILSSVAERILANAIPEFDPSRGVLFKTYLSHHVSGAVANALRMEGRGKRGRRLVAKTVERGRERMSQQLGRRPTDSEVAEHLGISEKVVIESASGELGIWCQATDATTTGTRPARQVQCDLDRKENFAEFTKSLPERSRTILWMYYFDGMTMADVGGRLGISKGLVRIILQKTLKLFRKFRTPEDFFDDKV